jgi:hypothetical protein
MHKVSEEIIEHKVDNPTVKTPNIFQCRTNQKAKLAEKNHLALTKTNKSSNSECKE